MYTQLNELNIYSFTILKIVSVRSGKKIQLMTTIPMNKILGRTILACKLFFGIFKEKPPFQNKNERTAMANTIGVGNIGGVATAIVSGGPGAVFWMSRHVDEGLRNHFGPALPRQVF